MSSAADVISLTRLLTEPPRLHALARVGWRSSATKLPPAVRLRRQKSSFRFAAGT